MDRIWASCSKINRQLCVSLTKGLVGRRDVQLDWIVELWIHLSNIKRSFASTQYIDSDELYFGQESDGDEPYIHFVMGNVLKT